MVYIFPIFIKVAEELQSIARAESVQSKSRDTDEVSSFSQRMKDKLKEVCQLFVV